MRHLTEDSIDLSLFDWFENQGWCSFATSSETSIRLTHSYSNNNRHQGKRRSDLLHYDSDFTENLLRSSYKCFSDNTLRVWCSAREIHPCFDVAELSKIKKRKSSRSSFLSARQRPLCGKSETFVRLATNSWGLFSLEKNIILLLIGSFASTFSLLAHWNPSLLFRFASPSLLDEAVRQISIIYQSLQRRWMSPSFEYIMYLVPID